MCGQEPDLVRGLLAVDELEHFRSGGSGELTNCMAAEARAPVRYSYVRTSPLATP